MISTKRVVVYAGIAAILILWQSFQVFVQSNHFRVTVPDLLVDNSLPTLMREDQRINDAGISEDPTTTKTMHKVIHLGIFGLGHRLLRGSAAWHLAQRWQISQFQFQWGSCGEQDDHDIFPYLFDTTELPVPRTVSNRTEYDDVDDVDDVDDETMSVTRTRNPRNVLIRNDVYGYLPTQSFLDHRLPLPIGSYNDKNSLLRSKVDSDTRLYQNLRDRFRSQDRIRNFQQQHNFEDHTVIGLHLRAGNGETMHFSYAGRQIANETEYVDNLMELIRVMVTTHHHTTSPKTMSWSKPPLLFLATDTPYLIPVVSNATQVFGVPTLVFPQIRMEDQQGVTFSGLEGAGSKCLLGWEAMWSDMILLSEVDVLIAARYSSFTQSLPLSLLMERKGSVKGPHFCEVSSNAFYMTCVQDMDAWLFRDDDQKMWDYKLPHRTSGDMRDGQVAEEDVMWHKKLIFLPESKKIQEYVHVLNFLAGNNKTKEATDGEIPTHTYGQKRFNPKYRKRKPVSDPGWNFTDIK